MPVPDPLAPLLDLPGVAEGCERARDAVAAVHRHRANLKGWRTTSAEACLRAARSSAYLDGGDITIPEDGDVTDSVLAGALRCASAMEGEGIDQLTRTLQRAPLQVFAKLHTLAAADLVDDPGRLGRPRPEPGVAERLDTLGQIIAGSGSSALTRVPAPLVVAVVHGDIAALRPFGVADGVVARAVARIVAVSRGLDPHNLGVPEVTFYRRSRDYQRLVEGFATGEPSGLAAWITFCCDALVAGSREARSIADAAG